MLGVEVEVVKLNVIGVLRRGPCLELLAMNFHEQRKGPSRPLFSRTRACPCLRAGFDTRSRCLLRMPPFLAQKCPSVIDHPLRSVHGAQAGGSRLGQGSLVEYQVEKAVLVESK